MSHSKLNLILISALILAGFTGLMLSISHPQTKQASSAIQAASPSPNQQPVAKLSISAAILPHHQIVKDQRLDSLKKLAAKITAPKTVILISPNHYDVGKALIQTTTKSWTLDKATLEPDSQIINDLINQKLASQETDSFTNEHGIFNLLADIHQVFPKAQLVPIILKTATNSTSVTNLANALAKSCSNCLMIGSVDFSHYQPSLLADLHDELTIRALQNLDTTTLEQKAEVDSPAALSLVAQWATLHQTKQLVIDAHTDSGVITQNPLDKTTTHLFAWYQTGGTVTPEDQVSFTIGGDMMFGRLIAHTFLSQGLPTALDQLGDRLFWGTDAGIVNLEGPVSDKPVPDDIRTNNLTFNFPPQAIDALSYLRVNVASQANNHSANAGAAGLATTRQLLTKAGIQPLGGPGDDGIDKVATITGQNLTLKIIGVHTLATVPNLAPLIRSLKTDSKVRVLVFPHWGNEYQYKHSGNQTEQAHAWIDAGADLVIGAHPHVIEDSELYKGKPIIYSMGNLLFDQTFSKETQQGLILSGKFSDRGLKLFALPVEAKSLKPQLMRTGDRQEIIDKLYAPFNQQKQETEAGTTLFFPN